MASYQELTGILKAVLRAVHGRSMSANGGLFETAMRLLREADAGKTKPTPWTPFIEMSHGRTFDVGLAAQIAKLGGISEAEARSFIESEAEATRVYMNSRYQVAIRTFEPDMVHLSIKRIDQEPVRSWRDMQRIKNELVGPECEAVELYPAESRLGDTANQYHLWASSDPSWRFPFGFETRLVSYEQAGGIAQEPLE